MEIPTRDLVCEMLILLTEWVQERYPNASVPGVEARLRVTDDGWSLGPVSADQDYENADKFVYSKVWLPYDANNRLCEQLAKRLLAGIQGTSE